MTLKAEFAACRKLLLVLDETIEERAARLFCEPLVEHLALELRVEQGFNFSMSWEALGTLLIGSSSLLQTKGKDWRLRLPLSLPHEAPSSLQPEGALASHFAVLGAEASGKTTLCNLVGERGGVVVVPEFVRLYVDVIGQSSVADLPLVALGTICQRRVFEATYGKRVFLHDTELHGTTVYAHMLFGHCPAWLDSLADDQHFDGGFLLDCELPWQKDPQRSFPELPSRQKFAFLLERRFFGCYEKLQRLFATDLEARVAQILSHLLRRSADQ